eukprot:15434673-Alexandrium_andersonii.AAC.1
MLGPYRGIPYSARPDPRNMRKGRRLTPACPCFTVSSASVSGPSSRAPRSSRTSRGRSWRSSAPWWTPASSMKQTSRRTFPSGWSSSTPMGSVQAVFIRGVGPKKTADWFRWEDEFLG